MDATPDIDLDLDLDPNFEPQTRARSNTWPLRPSREIDPQNSPVQPEENAGLGTDQQGNVKDPLGLTAKKSGSRRNAWGNLSYADLITKAIQSSPEKRLTLSQIYDWMVQNVPYFKDKGDSTSSAGWKNSIRHNLSLHNRFMRIQNEGTGKSSWWVLNPDAKPGKTPRRRAGSMETKCYEKKRGRIRKKIEALQATREGGGTLSPGASDDYLDTLSFGDFRSRASSNASSCGRLSPIHAAAESDLHDSQVPPMSPIPWGSEVNNSPTMYPACDSYSDLVDSLVDGMKLGSQNQQDAMKMDVVLRDPYLSSGNQGSPYIKVESQDSQYSQLPAPPPYPKQQSPLGNLDFSQQNFNNGLRQLRQNPIQNGSGNYSPPTDLFPLPENFLIKQEMVQQEAEGLSPANITSANVLSINTQQLSSPDRSQQGSPSTASPFSHLSPQPTQSPLTCQVSPQHNRHLSPQQQQQQHHPSSSASLQLQQQQQQQHQASILREALTRGGPPSYRSQTSSNLSPTFSPAANMTQLMSSGLLNNSGLMGGGGLSLSAHSSPLHQSSSLSQAAPPMRGGVNDAYADSQLGNMVNGNTVNVSPGCQHSSSTSQNNQSNSSVIPSDIDMDLISGLDYDMDQVIKQELTLEGNLDFNFDSGPNTPMGQNVVH